MEGIPLHNKEFVLAFDLTNSTKFRKFKSFIMVGFVNQLVGKEQPNNGMVGDPKCGAFSCVSPCVGESVFIVWPGAGRHMPSVR